VQGGDLFDAIVTGDRFRYTEFSVSNVLQQLLRAVNYLHSLRITHRNIRLENILVMTALSLSLSLRFNGHFPRGPSDGDLLLRLMGDSSAPKKNNVPKFRIL